MAEASAIGRSALSRPEGTVRAHAEDPAAAVPAAAAEPVALQPYLTLKAQDYHQMRVASPSVELVYAFRSTGEGACPAAVPDGCVDLAIGIGSSDVLVTIGGTVLAAKGWDFAGKRAWTGVRFRPGEAFLPTGLSPEDLVDRDIALDEASCDGRLLEALCKAEGPQGRMRVLAHSLAEPGARKQRPATHALRSLERVCRQMIVASGGCEPMGTVADAAGVSTRHMRRAFLAVQGISPKQFARFVRFQRAMGAMAAADDRTTAQAAALGCGYSDQSHLVHEFDIFAGMTPGQFRKTVRGGRQPFSPVAS